MPKHEIATLGGGCFWCLEAVYQRMDGVQTVVSGYMGGHMPDPNYKDVCTGATGHAEVVQLEFDPEISSYRDVLDVFFSIHDPTTRDRQGNDVGTQYRSVIFTHSDAQKATAEEAIREWNSSGTWSAPIVTEILPAETFYKAEEYHQNYFRTNPSQSYCMFVVAPKVRKFLEKFRNKARQEV